MNDLNVYIGWDKEGAHAYSVAEHSLIRHASITLFVTPLIKSQLEHRKLYYRKNDPLASTEFTYTRFLVPALNRFKGWALFCDCDFLFLDDIVKLLHNISFKNSKAVYCVQHNYTPKETTKMNGKVQTAYPRKNWSSLMLFNCAHESTKRLSVTTVNEARPQYLHRFEWCADNEIGALPKEWNWLEGHYGPSDGSPKAIHFTRGGPWLADWQDVDYGDLWQREAARVGL